MQDLLFSHNFPLKTYYYLKNKQPNTVRDNFNLKTIHTYDNQIKNILYVRDLWT